MRWRKSGAIVAVSILGIAVGAAPVAAYPTDAEQAGAFATTCETWSFTDPQGLGLWDDDTRNAVRNGFGRWEDAKTWDGKQVYDLGEEFPGLGEMDVYFQNELPDGAAGKAECDQGRVRFDADVASDLEVLEWLAAHEGGHAIGLGHASELASRGNDNPPTMHPGTAPGCTGTTDPTATYSQDDEAALINRHGTASPPSFHANQSFERFKTFWRKSGSGEWRIVSGNPADGDRNLQWKPNDVSDYIYQAVDLTILNLYTSGETVDGRVNHRHGGTQAGTVRLNVLAREIVYPGTCASFISLYDENNRTIPNGTWDILASTGWVSVGATWDWDTTSPAAFDVDWVGVHLQIRVKSQVRADGGTGELAWVHLDNTRAREVSYEE